METNSTSSAENAREQFLDELSDALCEELSHHGIAEPSVCIAVNNVLKEFFDEPVDYRTAPDLLHLAKLFQITCEDRLSLLRDDEKDWRADDEWEDMIGHYTSLLEDCQRILAKAHGHSS